MKSIEEIMIKFRSKLSSFSVKKGDCILLACSGGKDSSVMLDLFYKAADELELKLYAAYINHNLRGSESDEEESFVKNTIIGKYKLPLYIKTACKGELENVKGESVESAARKFRYSFLYETALNTKCRFIATAHNFNDKIETFFINILRGGGSETLNSIPSLNGNVIRPIIDITREEIDFYIINQHIGYIEDSTNSRNIYKRNIIRNDVVPVLKTVTGDLHSSFDAVFKHIDEDMDYLKKCASEAAEEIIKFRWDKIIGIDRAGFNALHSALKSRIVKNIFMEYGEVKNLTQGLINEVQDDGRVFLKKGELFIESKGKYLWFYKSAEYSEIKVTINELPFKDGEYFVEKSDGVYDFYPVFNCTEFPILIENINNDDFLEIKKGGVNIVKRLGEKGVPKGIALSGVVFKDGSGRSLGYYCGPFFECIGRNTELPFYSLKKINKSSC